MGRCGELDIARHLYDVITMKPIHVESYTRFVLSRKNIALNETGRRVVVSSDRV